MAFMDQALTFNTNWTTPQTITATSDSTVVVDLTGATQGKAPGFSPGVLPNIINGFPALNTAVGFDPGLGDGVAFPWLYVAVTAVNVSPTSNTLTVALKAAPDNGSGREGSYTTLYTSTAKAENVLVLGDYLIVPVPPTLFEWPSEALPRFYKLSYTAGGGSLAGLGVTAGLMLNPPSSLILGQYNNNFTAI